MLKFQICKSLEKSVSGLKPVKLYCFNGTQKLLKKRSFYIIVPNCIEFFKKSQDIKNIYPQLPY